MFKRIFKETVLVMSIALILSAFLFYVVIGNILLENTKKDMYDCLHLMDQATVHEELLESKEQLYSTLFNKPERFTIIDFQGQVLFESDVLVEEVMDNHLSRVEVMDAMENGEGYAIRYSSTLEKNMLYVAIACEDGPYVYRISVPYDGVNTYFPQILPVFSVVILISLFISVVFSYVFSKSITEPLKEISNQMVNFHQKKEVTFGNYADVELQNIVNTTKGMMEEIESQFQQLQKEKNIRQEFFSNASHELKTPLTSIRGYMELLESGVITDPKKQQDFFHRIVKEADSMTQLINDILMISKLESSEAEVVFSKVQIQDVCNEVVESLTPMAVKQNVHMLVHCEDRIVNTCYQHLHQILQNLVSNAIKYNKENGTVDICIKVEKNQLVIRVEDNGLGIKEEDRERVFERFYRQDKGRSKKVGGTGLGLSIVKHIVQYHQGIIRLTSKENVGTIITIYLPIHS